MLYILNKSVCGAVSPPKLGYANSLSKKIVISHYSAFYIAIAAARLLSIV